MSNTINKPKRHPLLEEGEQFDIVFDHDVHGRVEFSTGKNPLSGSWMWWFNVSHDMYAGTKADVRNIVNGIRKKATKIHLDTWRG